MEQKVQCSKFEGHEGKVQGTPEPSSRNTKESFSSEATGARIQGGCAVRCFRAWLKWVPATMCGEERVEMLCKSLGILRPAGQRPICHQLAAPGHSNQRPATSSRAFLFMATIVTVAASKEHDTGWSTPHLVGTGICGQIISRAPLSLPPGSSRSPPGGQCHSSGAVMTGGCWSAKQTSHGHR